MAAHKTRKPDEKIVITRRLECVEVQIDGHLARRDEYATVESAKQAMREIAEGLTPGLREENEK